MGHDDDVDVQSVAELIAAELTHWGVSAVDAAVFGTGDPEGIATLVESFCEEHLGTAPVGGLFYRSSTGCVLGLRLGSGQDVVLKAYQTRWTAPFLRAVQSVQAHVAAGGMPSARPRLSPTALAGRPNLVVTETWLPDPGMQASRSPVVRRASAAGLARQIRLCSNTGADEAGALASHPLQSLGGRLYPVPHSPLFDFEGTAAGAEWIDELAARAALGRAIDGADPVVAHTDWSARNVRVDEHGLHAVYDWDSVALVPESTAVGQAAVTWCVTSEPGGSEFPTLEEVANFLRDYEEAAGQELSPAQWRAAGAAAAWVLAYSARCEYSLAVIGEARADQHGAHDRLAEAGAALLELRRL